MRPGQIRTNFGRAKLYVFISVVKLLKKIATASELKSFARAIDVASGLRNDSLLRLRKLVNQSLPTMPLFLHLVER